MQRPAGSWGDHYWVAKPSRNLSFISWFFFLFVLFFSVSGKVLPVIPLLSGVFVHRVFCACFVRFEGAGVMPPWDFASTQNTCGAIKQTKYNYSKK